MQDQLLGRQIADFRVEALIGRGGMGRVYRARQTSLDRSVALKVLSVEAADDEQFRARFLRESRLAASIDHPNILPIYAAGEAEGRLYIAMRYVDGHDLRALLQREAPLSVERAVSFLRQAAGALDAAHDRGLVHRDVKPANFLIAQEHLYLADFGIAREASTSRDLTRVDAFVGTLDYASPEQIRHDAIDARTDLYSLACVFFECLSGTPPYDRPTEHGVMQAHLNDNPPSVSALRTGLPVAVDAVFAIALAKTPEDRYRTGRHFLQAIQTSLGSREFAPGPVPIAARETVIEVGSNQRGTATAIDHAPLPKVMANLGRTASVESRRSLTEAVGARSTAGVTSGQGRLSRSWLPVAIVLIATAAAVVVFATNSGAPSSLAAQLQDDARSHGWVTHVVASGESTNQIALTEHVALADLVNANLKYYSDIAKTTPSIGSVLLVPRLVAASASPTQSPDPTRVPPTPAPVATHPFPIRLTADQVVMPPSEFPLPGYAVARDQRWNSTSWPGGTPALSGWSRQFSGSPPLDYWWVDIRVFVYASTASAAAYVAGENCTDIFPPGSADLLSARETTAEVIGDGAKACVYKFGNNFSNWTEYVAQNRNAVVIISTEPYYLRITDVDAMNRAISIAKQQFAIIERVAPR